jgi:hypothetical protein
MDFHGSMTQTEIGRRLGISQMHVPRLRTRALGYLRSRLLDLEEAHPDTGPAAQRPANPAPDADHLCAGRRRISGRSAVRASGPGQAAGRRTAEWALPGRGTVPHVRGPGPSVTAPAGPASRGKLWLAGLNTGAALAAATFVAALT